MPRACFFNFEQNPLENHGRRQGVSKGRVPLLDFNAEMFGNSVKIHGIVPSMVDHAPSFAEVFEKFVDYLGTDILVGYHVRFDLHFFNVYMRQAHGFSVQNLVLDAQSMCRKVCFPPHLRAYAGRLKGHQDLDTVARHFGIEIQERHTALGDALATAMIFQRILIETEKTGPGRLQNLLAVSRGV